MDIKQKLTEKAGPLPVWGWAALITIAGVIYYHYRNSTSSNSSSSGSSDSAHGNDIVASEVQNLADSNWQVSNQLGLVRGDMARLAVAVNKDRRADESDDDHKKHHGRHPGHTHRGNHHVHHGPHHHHNHGKPARHRNRGKVHQDSETDDTDKDDAA